MKKYKNITIILIARFFLTLNFIALVKEVFLQDSGIGASVIVLTGFFYQVSKAIFEVPTGYFADKYGYKISVYMGIATQIIAIFTLSIASNISTILTFILVGFGNTFISGAFDALLYENIAKEQEVVKYKVINYMQYIDMGSRALALLITPNLLLIGGYQLVMWLSVTSLVVSMFCLSLVADNKLGIKNSISMKSKKLNLKIVKKAFDENQEVIGYFIVRKSFTIFDIPLEKFSILLFLNKGLSFETASIIFAISFFAYPIFSTVASKLPSRNSDRWLVASPLISDICIIAFVLTPNLILSVIMYFLSSFIMASSSIHNFVKVNSLIQNENRATMLSIDSLIMTFTAAMMYLLLAIVVENMKLVVIVALFFAIILNTYGRFLIKKSNICSKIS